MCFQCRALGAVINIGRSKENRFCCFTEVAQFDFRPTAKVAEELKDHGAAEYLVDTIQKFKNFGVELVPIRVEDDGSCLPHAVSRALVGHEVLFDAIRLELMFELQEHESFYKSLLQQGMNDETWEDFWKTTCEEAKPTLGYRTMRWLGPEHVLGLANVMRRPILVLDTPARMNNGFDLGSGLFLPYRHLTEGNSTCCNLQPIIVAWASPAHNHFVGMVQVEPDIAKLYLKTLSKPSRIEEELGLKGKLLAAWKQVIVFPRNMDNMPGAFEVPEGVKSGDVVWINDPFTYKGNRADEVSAEDVEVSIVLDNETEASREFLPLIIPEHASPGDIVSCRIPSRFTMGMLRLVLNPHPKRLRALKSLLQIFKKLMNCIVSGDTQAQQRVGTLPMDNQNVSNNILKVPGARMCLEAAGFVEDVNTILDKKRRVLCFKHMGRDANIADCVQVTQQLLLIGKEDPKAFKVFDNLSFDRFIDPAMETEVFGKLPVYYDAWKSADVEHPQLDNCSVASPWDIVRSMFTETNSWPVRCAADEFKLAGYDDKLVGALKRDITQLFPASFGSWDNVTWCDMRQLVCPNASCGVLMDWPDGHPLEGALAEHTQAECMDCGQRLDVALTLHHRILATITRSAKGLSGSLWRCTQCDSLQQETSICCGECGAEKRELVEYNVLEHLEWEDIGNPPVQVFHGPVIRSSNSVSLAERLETALRILKESDANGTESPDQVEKLLQDNNIDLAELENAIDSIHECDSDLKDPTDENE